MFTHTRTENKGYVWPLRNMIDMAKPRFVFLLLKEHPYGREMLKQIFSEGFIPEVIIEEDS